MMMIFSFLSAAIVLSCQTYTITRYILPILPFVYIIAAYVLVHFKYAVVAIPLVMVFVMLSLFSSNDPISNQIWYKRQVLAENFYARGLDGKDGITYNMQFLQLAKERDAIIRSGNFKLSDEVLNIDKTTLFFYKVAP